MASNLPKDSLEKFAHDVFTPLSKGQCVSCMFVAGGGKRTILKYLLSDETILKKIFGKQYQKTVFVYVDPDEILDSSNIHYLELMYNSLKREADKNKLTIAAENDHNYLLKIKEAIKELVSHGWNFVFILNDLEFTLNLNPSIYMNLESIMTINKTKVVYLFLSTINILEDNTTKQFHNLKYAISRNVLYFPLLNETEAKYLIERVAEQLKIKLSRQCVEALINLCGGHPQLLKYSVNDLVSAGNDYLTNVNKTKNYLLTYFQNKIICADILNYLNPEEKNIINQIVATGRIPADKKNEITYLVKLGIISEITDQKYKVFGLIFEEFIKNKLPVSKLTYDPDSNKIYHGANSCEDKFTYQEFKLLVYFLTHNNELVTRDQVAEVMWGKHLYQERYSDYSIDKIISTIRKKLDNLGYPSQNLVTLKKRGFSFSNA